VLPVSIFALSRGPAQHQSDTSAVKEGKRRRRIEEVLHPENIPVELFCFLDVGYWEGDLLYAGERG
jgi:hypothetical protein